MVVGRAMCHAVHQRRLEGSFPRRARSGHGQGDEHDDCAGQCGAINGVAGATDPACALSRVAIVVGSVEATPIFFATIHSRVAIEPVWLIAACYICYRWGSDACGQCCRARVGAKRIFCGATTSATADRHCCLQQVHHIFCAGWASEAARCKPLLRSQRPSVCIRDGASGRGALGFRAEICSLAGLALHLLPRPERGSRVEHICSPSSGGLRLLPIW